MEQVAKCQVSGTYGSSFMEYGTKYQSIRSKTFWNDKVSPQVIFIYIGTMYICHITSVQVRGLLTLVGYLILPHRCVDWSQISALMY